MIFVSASAFRLAYQEIDVADSPDQWRKITFDTDVLNFNIWRYTGTKPDTSQMKYLTIVVEGNKNRSEGIFYVDQIEFKKNLTEKIPITSDEMLFFIEKKATQYFWDWYCEKNGLFYHRIPSGELFSPIATGYGLIALCIAAKNYWLSFSQCKEMSSSALGSLLKMINEQQTSSSTGYGGFFYQFLDSNGKRKDIKTQVVVSDHIFLLIGALVNGTYFGAEIEEKADSLWAAARWPLFIRSHGYNKDKLYYGWSPEKSEGFQVVENERDGFFSGMDQETPLNMDYYSDEKILMSILAMGSANPQNRLDKKIFYSWNRVKAQYGNFIQSWNGSLDEYTLSLLFLNYRQLGYDLHYKSEWQLHWLENAQNFIIQAQQYQERNPFTTFWWGITACESFVESKLDSITFESFGLEPNGNNETMFNGTYAPHSLFSGLAFGENFRANSINAIKELYPDKYLFGDLYGFYESANRNFQGEFLNGLYNRSYLSFHVGQIMIAIENYLTSDNNTKSGFIQNLFMQKTEPVLRELFSFAPDSKPEIPEAFSINHVCPNPFRNKTEIIYSLPYSLPATIRIFNILGQELKEYSESIFKQAGKYTWHWEPESELPSGIYFWTIEYNQSLISQKLIYLHER